MNIVNIHKRVINRRVKTVGPLFDCLSSSNDLLWPHEKWPPMKFDRRLGEGAKGGHGPIRYLVKQYNPGKKIIFEFSGPPGFHGNHYFELEEKDENNTVIRHTINMNATGPALLSWPIIFRPLHDALLEDSFDKLEKNLALEPKRNNWSAWVRLLRRILKKKKRA